MDALKAGNEARMINDYRGIGKKPNVEFVIREGQVKGVRVKRMGVSVLAADIDKGAELLLSYGKGYWAARQEKSRLLRSQTYLSSSILTDKYTELIL